MAQLSVRRVDEAIVRELRRQASRHGRSSEDEHRAILVAALCREPARRSFKDHLAAMPDVGDDDDFARFDQGVGDRPRGVSSGG